MTSAWVSPIGKPPKWEAYDPTKHQPLPGRSYTVGTEVSGQVWDPDRNEYVPLELEANLGGLAVKPRDNAVIAIVRYVNVHVDLTKRHMRASLAWTLPEGSKADQYYYDGPYPMVASHLNKTAWEIDDDDDDDDEPIPPR